MKSRLKVIIITELFLNVFEKKVFFYIKINRKKI
jgi:hypothetical protein